MPLSQTSLASLLQSQKTLILDGGMGRELHKMGAPFKQPEWSALALSEGPSFVQKAHESFIEAGANIITTNSYAVVPYHIGTERFSKEGEHLARKAGELGRKALHNAHKPNTFLAGSLPPTSGSYRPDLFKAQDSQEIHQSLIAGLSPYVDLWLAETHSSIIEAQTTYRTLDPQDTRPFWISFTLDDTHIQDVLSENHPVSLRSGETVHEAVHAMLALNVDAILFNCSDPHIMEKAITTAHSIINTTPYEKHPLIGVYANAFISHDHGQGEEANETISEINKDLTPELYLQLAAKWKQKGARIIGGCCGIGPEHIKEISQYLE